MDKPNPNGRTHIQRCEHRGARGASNWDDLNISFCPECGTIIVTTWDTGTRQEKSTIYISPEEAWIYYQMAINPKSNFNIEGVSCLNHL